MLAGSARSIGPYDPADPPAAHAEQLGRARALLAERGVEAVLVPAHGDPVDAILRLADEIAADLIVLAH